MTAARELEFDILIVGAGPVGLFGADYAGFRELRVAVMDSLPEVGGQISAMYPDKDLLDIAGFPAVVITGGIGTFTPRALSTGTEFVGRGLAYFVPRLADYAGTDVVIVGGGDSAFDWAQTLHPIARSVTLVHRRDTFRAHAQTVSSVRQAQIPIVTGAQVSRVLGNAAVEAVEAVEVTVDGEDAPRRLDCQRLVAALGFVANLGPLRKWGLDIANNGHIVVDSAMRTNFPGVFAAGDITDYDGKVRLIAVGFDEVALAVNNAAVHIDPGQALFPGHSTDAASQPVAVAS